MKAIDFFCGAGGLTRGLLDAGIDVLGGFDIDESCSDTYELNNRRAFHAADVRDLEVCDLRRHFKMRSFSDVIFAGCAPCQPFSQQRKSPIQDKSATLLGEFGRLVSQAKPAAAIIENVPGMAKVGGFSTFRRFCSLLEDSGYRYCFDVLDAKAFGVPQNRRRLVLIAVRRGTPSLPAPTFGKRRPYKTVRSAIGHFPELAAGESHPTVPNHICAEIAAINLERLRKTPHDGGDRRSWPESLHLVCHANGYLGHTDVYGRMAWDCPAPTLTSKCNSISNGRYGHPVQDRAISLREAAALQTFPDGYRFNGSSKHIARQIGNAVPVRFAAAIGRHLKKMV